MLQNRMVLMDSLNFTLVVNTWLCNLFIYVFFVLFFSISLAYKQHQCPYLFSVCLKTWTFAVPVFTDAKLSQIPGKNNIHEGK